MDNQAKALKNAIDRVQNLGNSRNLHKINQFSDYQAQPFITKLGERNLILKIDKFLEKLEFARTYPHDNQAGRDLSRFADEVTNMYKEELAKLLLEETGALEVLPQQVSSIVPEDSYSHTRISQQSPVGIISTSNCILDPRSNNENTKNQKPNPAVIADEVVHKHKFVIYQDGIYLHIDGYYKLVTENAIRRLLNTDYRSLAECYGFAKFYDHVIDFIYCDQSLVVDNKDFDLITYLIAFRDGFLDTKTLQFCKPDPRLFFTSNVNVNFCSSSQEMCPNFDAFLNQIANGDGMLIMRIYEVIGYILSNDLNAKSIFVFQGVSNSGKSTLIKFISSFFNDDLVTALPVGELDRNFAASELIGKALCADTELTAVPLKTACVAKLKQLSCKDLLSSDVKYRSRAKFICRAKILLATNHVFQLDHRDDAFIKRIVTIPFYNEIPKAQCNPELLNIFEYERLAIVKKAITHYCRLRDNRYVFSGEFQINDIFTAAQPVASKHASISKEDWIECFLEECCLIGAMDDCESTDEIHKMYSLFCESNQTVAVSQKTLTLMIKKILGDKVESGKKRIITGENPVSILCGLKLKKDRGF